MSTKTAVRGGAGEGSSSAPGSGPSASGSTASDTVMSTNAADTPATGCTLDTDAMLDVLDNGGYQKNYEYVTRAGKLWVYRIAPLYGSGQLVWFNTPNDPWSIDEANGLDLTKIERYAAANGPCHGRSAGTCRFDTHTFVRLGNDIWESITADGRYWNFVRPQLVIEDGGDWDYTFFGGEWRAQADNGSPLTDVKRFAEGPCSRAPEGKSCKLDTRTFVKLDGKLWESITAYGAYWNFIAPTYEPQPDNGTPLSEVGRYAEGPCAGHKGDCNFSTRTFFGPSALNPQEAIVADGKFWVFSAPNWKLNAGTGTEATRFMPYLEICK